MKDSRSIVPGTDLEVCYRFIQPLPTRVTVNGQTWEFALSKPDHPPYFSLQLSNLKTGSFYMIDRYDTNDQAESRPYQEVRVYYPGVTIRYFEEAVKAGRAERTVGVHHRLYYRSPFMTQFVNERAEALKRGLP